MPWIIYYIEEFKERKSDKELILNSLNVAVELAKTKAFDKYLSGFAAYNYWINLLSDEANFHMKNNINDKMHPNAWIYVSLIDARLAAANYFKQINNLIFFENIDIVINNKY